MILWAIIKESINWAFHPEFVRSIATVIILDFLIQYLSVSLGGKRCPFVQLFQATVTRTSSFCRRHSKWPKLYRMVPDIFRALALWRALGTTHRSSNASAMLTIFQGFDTSFIVMCVSSNKVPAIPQKYQPITSVGADERTRGDH